MIEDHPAWTFSHIHVAEIDSTNSRAFTLGREGAASGTVVTSDSQCKGRGQRGNHWYSPAGKGLYYSLLLRPEMTGERVPLITLAAGIAVVDVLDDVFSVRVRLKWPNDVLLSGKKVAGILTESSWHGDRIDFVIIGIGLNLDWREDEFPSGLAYPATSLYLHTERRMAVSSLVETLTDSLRRWTTHLAKHGPATLLAAWEERTDIIGHNVEVSHNAGVLQGLAIGLNQQGALLVDTPGKGVTVITAGTVRFVD